MKVRRRSRILATEENDGASTSYDDRSLRSTTSPMSEKNEPYHFPSDLAKERHWRENAISVKINSEAAKCVDVTTVFDFFNKLSTAFNLTPVTEQQLDEAIMSERSSGSAAILVKMIVELISGFSSIDYSHHVKMYQRNRIYHETNSETYNQSLWVFLDHDWKFLDFARWEVKNILGPSKENADFFALPFRLRSILMLDLCMYRLSCPDAQDMIDSAVDERISVGSQLRTEAIGFVDNADFYYFGGMRVYRSRMLTKKERNMKKSKKSGAKYRVSNKLKTEAETKVEMKLLSETYAFQNDSETGQLSTTDVSACKKEDNTSGLNDSLTISNGSVNGYDLNTLMNQEYFLNLNDEQFTWEVVCSSEEDVHYLIEYCRTSHAAGSKALSGALINIVLPSVQECFRKQKERERIALKASRFLPRIYDSSQFGEFELRHSRRLEQKKIEREKQIEEQRRVELEMENMIREQEGKRKLHTNDVIAVSQQKISREERLRLREQRILEQEAEKRRKLEDAKTSSAENGTENHEPSASTSISVFGLNADQKQNATAFNDANYFKVHRRKQSFDFCEKLPLFSVAQQEYLKKKSLDDLHWKHPRFNEDEVSNSMRKRSFQDRKYADNVEHSSFYGNRSSYEFLENHNRSFDQPAFKGQNSCLPVSPQSVPTYDSGLLGDKSSLLNGITNDYRKHPTNFTEATNPKERYFGNLMGANFASPAINQNYPPPLENSEFREHGVETFVNGFQCNFILPSTSDLFHSNDVQNSDDEDLGRIAATKYLDYPSAESSECFRIVVPDGSYMTLLASGPLLDHDYIVPPVELIMDQNWKFAADPIDSNSSFQPIEFSLQKQEPVAPVDELVDVET